MPIVNDSHCQASRTHVGLIREVHSAEEIRSAIVHCREQCMQLSCAGGRHSLGRQAFASDQVLLDLNCFRRVIELDEGTGIVRVQGGAQWLDIREHLTARDSKWEIHQKQTGADTISLAGTIAANAHGNGMNCGPIGDEIVWFKLVDSEGVERFCSRDRNAELFTLALGGFGLFGVITEIALQLVPRDRFCRHSDVCLVSDVVKQTERLHPKYAYADMQLDIDPNSPLYLQRGVFNRWERLGCDALSGTQLSRAATAPLAATPPADWQRLVTLCHCDKRAAFEAYSRFAENVNGRLECRKDFLWDSYTPNYHRHVETALGLSPGGELLAEFFVPTECLDDFLLYTRQRTRLHSVNLILSSLRWIRRDNLGFLRWAKRDFACVVFAMHVDHRPECFRDVDLFCSSLADFCAFNDGSFYLPYRLYAEARTLKRAYPMIQQFIDSQQKLDPDQIFGTDWHAKLKKTVGVTCSASA